MTTVRSILMLHGFWERIRELITNEAPEGLLHHDQQMNDAERERYRRCYTQFLASLSGDALAVVQADGTVPCFSTAIPLLKAAYERRTELSQFQLFCELLLAKQGQDQTEEEWLRSRKLLVSERLSPELLTLDNIAKFASLNGLKSKKIRERAIDKLSKTEGVVDWLQFQSIVLDAKTWSLAPKDNSVTGLSASADLSAMEKKFQRMKQENENLRKQLKGGKGNDSNGGHVQKGRSTFVPLSDRVCRNCGVKGHMQKDCKKPKK